MVNDTPARRKSLCGIAGSTVSVGRCSFWWESCPAKVKHCELRARNVRAAADA